MSVSTKRSESPPGPDSTNQRAGSVSISDVEKLYRFRVPDVVRSYLARHPELLDAVAETNTVIQRIMPGSQSGES